MINQRTERSRLLQARDYTTRSCCSRCADEVMNRYGRYQKIVREAPVKVVSVASGLPSGEQLIR
jgi:hypothetical protein